MFQFLRKLFADTSAPPAAAEPVTYKDFEIVANPSPADAGWRIQATITKHCDGELKSHAFIRADTVGDRDGAIEMTLTKARRTIDEQGERIFELK